MHGPKSGTGRLQALHPITSAAMEEIEVDYEVHFYTSLRAVRGGFPPVVERNAEVLSVRGIDGRDIPEGHYELQTDDEHIRLNHLGGGVWAVLKLTGG